MDFIDLDGQASACYAHFTRLLIENKAEIGMDDIPDVELLAQAPIILGSLVRISINALRNPGEPDNAHRLVALRWFVAWASRGIEGFPARALAS